MKQLPRNNSATALPTLPCPPFYNGGAALCRPWRRRSDSCSDSWVVLHWLQSEGSLSNDFVDNYVSQIHEIVPNCQWRYVSTTHNLADIATRGSDPLRLSQNQLWWSGLEWLANLLAAWPTDAPQPPLAPDSTRLTCLITQVLEVEIADADGFSSLNRVLISPSLSPTLSAPHQPPNTRALRPNVRPKRLFERTSRASDFTSQHNKSTPGATRLHRRC